MIPGEGKPRRLIPSLDAICREAFKRAFAITFNQFARQIGAIPIP
jgi:hypothetical protein